MGAPKWTYGLGKPDCYVESWTESIHDESNPLADGVQIPEDEGMFRIAQGYLNGCVTVHLHLRVRPIGLKADTHEFCAVFASDRGDIVHVNDLAYVFDGDRVPREEARILAFGTVGDADGRRDRHGAADVDESVLVHVVQPSQQGGVRLRRAFSVLKGLDRLDRCPIIRAHAAKRAPLQPFSIPLPAFLDGELRLASGAAPSEQHELPRDIIQRGPQVVRELPDDDPDTGMGQLSFEAKDVLAGIALEVTDDEAIFLVNDGVSFTVERGQVLVRAFESPIDGF